MMAPALPKPCTATVVSAGDLLPSLGQVTSITKKAPIAVAVSRPRLPPMVKGLPVMTAGVICRLIMLY